MVLAITFMLLLVRWFGSTSFPRFALDGNLGLLLSYLVVWVPLLGACAIACYLRGTRSPARDFGLRFTWLDVLFGLGVGLLVRALASVIEIAVYGRMSLGGVTFGETIYDGWWMFGTLLAPILIAPFVEELFFRGLVLRATLRAGLASGGRGAASVVAVIVSAALFSLLHLVEVSNVQTAIVLGLSTLILGLATGAISLFTGRIGGAMVAHATFNGSLILASLLS